MMKVRISIFLIALVTALPVWAAGDEGVSMHMNVNLTDKKSLQRGARIFVNYCLSCHSADYMRYNRLGKDLGITERVLKENFMFGTDKTGDTMTIAMTKADGEKYFGVAPPDLSVTARARGADWLYTYFMTFYRDKSRPLGVNNLAFKDVGMPHVLWELQGWQRPVYSNDTDASGNTVKVIDSLELETEGSLSADEYEQTIRDLVNFLVYLGEPIQLKRYSIGVWVIMYLFVLLIVVYVLKREYWRDVH